MRVFLDPGHGSNARGEKDPGAIGSGQIEVTEAEVVWPIAILAGHMLRKKGHHVRFSRTLDAAAPLKRRSSAADAWEADIVVSIHCNSAEDARAHGFEVLHFGSPEGARLAGALLGAIDAKSGAAFAVTGDLPIMRSRGLKVRRELEILRGPAAPAALVELGFISNIADRGILSLATSQIGFAEAIVSGIETYGAER